MGGVCGWVWVCVYVGLTLSFPPLLIPQNQQINMGVPSGPEGEQDPLWEALQEGFRRGKGGEEGRSFDPPPPRTLFAQRFHGDSRSYRMEAPDSNDH